MKINTVVGISFLALAGVLGYWLTAGEARIPSTSMLDKCVLLSNADAYRTPDEDRAKDWKSARDAFLATYAGNWSSLRLFHRFDVRYPGNNNPTVRFMLNSWRVSGDVEALDVVSLGWPDEKDTPCKELDDLPLVSKPLHLAVF